MPTASSDALPALAVPATALPDSGVASVKRGPLARRYFRQLAGLSVGLLVAAGSIEAWFGYVEARAGMARIQSLQAQSAASEIEQYLKGIERSLQAVQQLPWGRSGFAVAQRREELHRLLAISPSIVELRDLDARGRELLSISRRIPDRLGHGAQMGSLVPGFGLSQFDDSGAPFVQLVLTRAGEPAGQTVARIDLRFLVDVVSGLRVADGGDAYVVDDRNQLIAHADPTELLRQRQLDGSGVVQLARAAALDHQTPVLAVDAPGLRGDKAISTAVRLPAPRWLVVVEHPRSQAMQPVIATLQRTLGLLGLAALLAMLASAAFSRRMAAPIARLRAATAGMASGQLAQSLQIKTGDEIEALAEDFNAMSTRLQQSYAELEQKVEERTAELSRQRADAERANAAKTRFLAAASHDLRQPMHAIGLMVGLLRHRAAEVEQRELADRTHAAVRSMETLFGSLLDVSKLDAGAVRPQRLEFALEELLARVQRSYAPLAEAKGLRLRVRHTDLAVHSDPALLERILGNLVANAVRYTRSGGVLVAARAGGDGQVHLQVIDSGVGINPGQLELIFEEFVRLGEPGAGDDGLGLGLSIVRRTANLLGHAVSVRSRPGRGSSFTVTLQRARQPHGFDLPHGDPMDAAVLSGAFVMVVDDDARNRSATAALLAHHGCLVAQAADAAAALHEVTQHLRTPDVLVTDLRLGHGPDGLALVRALRQQTEACMPALLVTAETSLPAHLDGDIQVLLKPAGSDALLRALAQALAG